jgi:glucan phosphoethanolaminetransferase (alkaline phosphatase superfamily)
MPVELISTFRKKINIHLLIVSMLAIIVIGMNFLFQRSSLVILQVIRILTFFLVIHALALYQRRNSLFKIFNRNPSEVISTFETYLQERKQNTDRNKIIRIIMIVLLTVGLLYELLDYNNNAWSGSIIPLWFAAILLIIAEKWSDMNTHIMLQDLKHNEK